MVTATAWGGLNLYALPDGGHLWGREFQVLPTGSMLGGAKVLDGLIGCDAQPVDGGHCEIRQGSPLKIYGIRGTETCDLSPYSDELAEQFNAQHSPHTPSAGCG